MQYEPRSNQLVRALATWSGALAGMMMILVGGFIPVHILVATPSLSTKLLVLPSTWQVPALLLCSLVCGARAGVIASSAYLTIGLFHLPIFHDGGSLEYALSPGFGFLAGFIPASWLSGMLSQQNGMNNIKRLTQASIAGLILIQACGVFMLIAGSLFNLWSEQLPQLLISYSLGPLPTQLALCISVGILALPIRRLLFIE